MLSVTGASVWGRRGWGKWVREEIRSDYRKVEHWKVAEILFKQRDGLFRIMFQKVSLVSVEDETGENETRVWKNALGVSY